MSQPINASQIYNTFFHLLQELEPFIETADLKIAFDAQGNAYLLGQHFQEQLHANFAIDREVRDDLRTLIARHCTRKGPGVPGA